MNTQPHSLFLRLASLFALLAGTILPSLPTPRAPHSTWVVTKTTDTNDGMCDSDCSLREAIALANAAPNEDAVTLPAGVYRLTLGQLLIANPLVLSGALSPTTIIHASPNDSALRINTAVSVTVTGVTIRGGHSIGGGGVNNFGLLTIEDSAVMQNTGALSGGIYNYGQLVIHRSAITENTSGWSRRGGGIDNSGVLTITESLIAENTGGNGGGVNNSGAVWIITSTVRDNGAYQTYGGGGIYNTGALTLTASTLYGNRALDFGGGLENAGGQTAIDQSQIVYNIAVVGGGVFNGSARLNVADSTVANNTGGGVHNGDALTLTNSTLANNLIPSDALNLFKLRYGSGLYNTGLTSTARLNNVTLNGNQGYGIYQEGGAVSLKNTLVAGPDSLPSLNCFGALTSQDYNFIHSAPDCVITGATAHNITETNPLLGFLQDNGGGSWTLPLLTGSPALEAGNPGAPGSGGDACEASDQRGVSRPQASRCDIGASEGVYSVPTDFIFSQRDSVDPVAVGQTLTYTLNVTNTSGGLLTGVRVTDTLPAAVTFASIVASLGSCDFNAGVVACGPVALSDGGVLSVTIAVTPTRAALLLNEAQVTSEAGFTSTLVNTTTRESTSVELFTPDANILLPAVTAGALTWADYDNDNDLDALITGDTGAERIARLYRNDGPSAYVLAVSFTGVDRSTAVWGDYDNDNDLDLVVTGYTGTAPSTQLYRNDGASFTPIAAGLVGVQRGAVAWADMDNDGDLDLGLAGQSAVGPVTVLYRNAGGVFTDSGAVLPGVVDGSLAWGDYDNDGDPDLALLGNTGLFRLAKIYRNTNGVFADSGLGFPGMDRGSAAWTDQDNDGALDLLLAGNDGCGLSGCGNLYFYRNLGGANFELLGLTTTSLSTTVAWGDYDNDGDPDVGHGSAAAAGLSTVYRNEGQSNFVDARLALAAHWETLAWGDADNDGDLDVLASRAAALTNPPTSLFRNYALTPNTPPTAPAGLAVVVSGTTALLQWNAASDAQTPAAGLTYNVRVGTTPGGSEILSAMADGAGFRRLPALGNAGPNLALPLKNLTVGLTYYWSVQAIDSAWAGSAFASESSFVASESTATPTLTATLTPTATATETPTRTATATATLTLTRTSTLTATLTRTATSTPTLTQTPTLTRTLTPTKTPTPTATATKPAALSFPVYLPLINR